MQDLDNRLNSQWNQIKLQENEFTNHFNDNFAQNNAEMDELVRKFKEEIDQMKVNSFTVIDNRMLRKQLNLNLEKQKVQFEIEKVFVTR